MNTTDAQFLIYPANDTGWVLRDKTARRDYPFETKDAAVQAAKLLSSEIAFLAEGLADALVSSPTRVSAYGEPPVQADEVDDPDEPTA